MILKIFTDGGARGNPGPAACAFVVYGEHPPSREASVGKTGNLLEKRGKHLGVKTNNEAEYQGVIEALGWLGNEIKDKGCETKDKKQENGSKKLEVSFFLDSSLVVNQLNGLYKVKEPRLRELLLEVRELEAGLSPTVISYGYVPREQNAEADRLVNETLDQQTEDKLDHRNDY